MTDGPSLRAWLREQIVDVLGRKGTEPPLLIWCDPERVWPDLLRAAAEGQGFEVWADDTHELLLRERFYGAERAARLVWLPVARENIGYFKVFELQAADLKDWTLVEALAEYGVEIPSDQLADLKPLLAAHAKEWLDRPRSAWKELTPGNASGTLVDDDRILEVLASSGTGFDSLLADNRFGVFCRRIIDDFGLPAPKEKEGADAWRLRVVAAFLCTDAAAKCPDNPPGDLRVIPAGPKRDRALKLLGRWQKQIDLIGSFESLAAKADGQTLLQQWARNVTGIPTPLASPIAEKTLFEKEVEQLARLDAFEAVAGALDGHLILYQSHASAFWGKTANVKVQWDSLVQLAASASLLQQHIGAEKSWTTTNEAVRWFTHSGWEVDHAGERLLQEDSALAGGLVGARAKLRRAYLRHLDSINAAFSELLARDGEQRIPLPFAGDVIQEIVERAAAKDPVAVVILDACRYDLACRLAESLNRGEPARRAEVSAAIAPLPTITAIGMPFCLPGAPKALRVDYLPPAGWTVRIAGFTGNLTEASQRREWLKKTFRLKDSALFGIGRVVDSDRPDDLSSKSLGRLVFVFGDEFDTEGHEGQLKLTGCDDHLERYSRAMRRLRASGYSTIVVVTDHGFFHWDPEQDEIEASPSGELLWTSRRAAVGHELKHATALDLAVTASDLSCRVPRSVNAFRAYGGLGYFHGGATLQELLIPVVVARWPKKAAKVSVVLKPVSQITSLKFRVEIASASRAQGDLFGEVSQALTGRPVHVKVIDQASGKVLFRSAQPVSIDPASDSQFIEIARVEGAEGQVDAALQIIVIDADDEEILDRGNVVLKVSLDEWY